MNDRDYAIVVERVERGERVERVELLVREDALPEIALLSNFDTQSIEYSVIQIPGKLV